MSSKFNLILPLEDRAHAERRIKEFEIRGIGTYLKALLALDREYDLISLAAQFKHETKDVLKGLKIKEKVALAEKQVQLRHNLDLCIAENTRKDQLMKSERSRLAQLEKDITRGKVKTIYYRAKYEVSGECPSCGKEIIVKNLQPKDWEVTDQPPQTQNSPRSGEDYSAPPDHTDQSAENWARG